MSVLESWVASREDMGGTMTLIHKDHGMDDVTHVEYRGNVDNIVEVNKEHAAILGPRPGHKGNQTHVARVHPVVFWELKKAGIADDPERLRKWLNDRDNSCWRTHPGKV